MLQVTWNSTETAWLVPFPAWYSQLLPARATLVGFSTHHFLPGTERLKSLSNAPTRVYSTAQAAQAYAECVTCAALFMLAVVCT